MKDKKAKWNEAYKDADISTAKPAQILSDNSFLLPQKGIALDLACGRAGNAIFLANLGFKVDAIDNSSLVLEHINKYTEKQNLDISCELRDIESDGLSDKKYDVIVISYFLNRGLFPEIIQALKPNGLLFYQTWSQLKRDDSGPNNPAFRLAASELLELCAPLRPILYRENGLQGDTSEGLRNEAILIAQKVL